MKRAVVVFRSAMRARPDLRRPIPLLTEVVDVGFGVHREPPVLTEVVEEPVDLAQREPARAGWRRRHA